jgi:hypothetical protein
MKHEVSHSTEVWTQIWGYSEPSLVLLQLIQTRKMKNFAPSWVQNFERHIAIRKADESRVCSDKTWRFLQICIITTVNSEFEFHIVCVEPYVRIC